MLGGKTLGVASAVAATDPPRGSAGVCRCDSRARVCRAAEQERERAEFFWQRLGRCATWREGSLVTRAVRPLFYCAGGFCRFHLGETPRPPKIPQNFPPTPPPLSLSLKQNKTEFVGCWLVGWLQTFIFLPCAFTFNIGASRGCSRARPVFAGSKLTPSKASFRLASTFPVAANASSS